MSNEIPAVIDAGEMVRMSEARKGFFGTKVFIEKADNPSVLKSETNILKAIEIGFIRCKRVKRKCLFEMPKRECMLLIELGG